MPKNPQTTYINYMDLDLGTNNWSDDRQPDNKIPNPEVEAARAWGERYFLGNYDRLVRAKTTIDPDNVFRNAQSIPPLRVPGVTRSSPRGISPEVISNGSTYDSLLEQIISIDRYKHTNKCWCRVFNYGLLLSLSRCRPRRASCISFCWRKVVWTANARRRRKREDWQMLDCEVTKVTSIS